MFGAHVANPDPLPDLLVIRRDPGGRMKNNLRRKNNNNITSLAFTRDQPRGRTPGLDAPPHP